jgi:hypothetical protein
MTANYQALNASLAAKQPNHLPESAWAADSEAIIKQYTELGLAPVPGRGQDWTAPSEARQHPQW